MRQITSFAGILFFASGAFAADPQLLNLAMPNAQIMAGVNVTTAKISPLGQYILTQISANDTGLQKFITATGFDPRQDVTEILAASVGDRATPGGLVLAKGTFDVPKLVGLISGDQKQQVQTYAGATLITSTDPKMQHALAFVGATIAVAGDVTSVKAALDRSSAVNSISPALATQVQALSTTQDAWTVSLVSGASLLPGNMPTAGTAAQTVQFLKNIQSSSGGVKFGTNVVITGEAVADTPQNATSLADVIRMFSSLASMGAEKNGKAGAAQFLQNLKVTTTGNTVNVTDSIPESELESLIRLAETHKAALTGPAASAHSRKALPL